MVTAAPDIAVDLEPLDEAVERAIDVGQADGLRTIGFGEISLVIAWPAERPVVAAKRLPLFPSAARAVAHAALVTRYVTVLRDRGVGVLATDVRSRPARDGRHVYVLQPFVERDRILTEVLTRAAPERGAALLRRLVDAVWAAVDERVGLDAQAGNWAVDGDRIELFDVSTPLLRGPDGRPLLDVPVFVSDYPWARRPVLRPVAGQVMVQYHDPRTVLLDVASNLHKEELGGWIPAFLAIANERVGPPIDAAEVERYFRRDRALWLLMQRLRRADRAWQRAIRHRRYPFLLAPPYRYGPMTPPGEVP